MQLYKTRNKSLIIIISIIVFVAVAVIYIYIAKSKEPKPSAKSVSPIDITPLIVAKLQQMVISGSDSLYKLSIEQLKPDITSSQVDIIHATLTPDSAILQKLDKEGKAPDDVFTLSFTNIHITGLSVADFLHKKRITLDTIFVSSPVINVAHTERPYNAAIRARDSALSVYQKLSEHFTNISIGAIIVKDGAFAVTNLSGQKKTTRLNGVEIDAGNIQIDSLTQFDKNRFLFSKTASFSCKDFMALTPDSLYIFKVGSFSVAADKHMMIAKNVALEPRGNKEEFQKKLTSRNDMFTIHFPEIVCTNMDWWALLNRTRFNAGEVMVRDGSVKDYFNRALPSRHSSGKKDNFPQQLLMQVPLSIDVHQLKTQRLQVSYEEYSPQSKQSGTVIFNDITATVNNITNTHTQIKLNPFTDCLATALFMNKVPLTAHFRFDLSKLHTGNFSSHFHIGTITNSIINPVAEPMGMFTIKSGTVNEATIDVNGDNLKADTRITMLYNDLRIFQLKDPGDKGDLKKRSILGFFANAFVIKDANPSGDKAPRSPDVMVKRDDGSFFNFLWKSVLSGIVKTVGIPKKFANQ